MVLFGALFENLKKEEVMKKMPVMVAVFLGFMIFMGCSDSEKSTSNSGEAIVSPEDSGKTKILNWKNETIGGVIYVSYSPDGNNYEPVASIDLNEGKLVFEKEKTREIVIAPKLFFSKFDGAPKKVELPVAPKQLFVKKHTIDVLCENDSIYDISNILNGFSTEPLDMMTVKSRTIKSNDDFFYVESNGFNVYDSSFGWIWSSSQEILAFDVVPGYLAYSLPTSFYSEEEEIYLRGEKEDDKLMSINGDMDPLYSGAIVDIEMDPGDGKIIFVKADRSQDGYGIKYFRTLDRGDHWEEMDRPVLDVVSASDQSFVFSSSAYSVNSGYTWIPFDRGLDQFVYCEEDRWFSAGSESGLYFGNLEKNSLIDFPNKKVISMESYNGKLAVVVKGDSGEAELYVYNMYDKTPMFFSSALQETGGVYSNNSLCIGVGGVIDSSEYNGNICFYKEDDEIHSRIDFYSYPYKEGFFYEMDQEMTIVEIVDPEATSYRLGNTGYSLPSDNNEIWTSYFPDYQKTDIIGLFSETSRTEIFFSGENYIKGELRPVKGAMLEVLQFCIPEYWGYEVVCKEYIQ